MADAVISTVKINIEADTGDAESRINRLNDALRNLGKGGSGNAGVKTVEKDASTAEKKVSSLTGALGKLSHALGRIALYRALRSIIKMITQAFSEGLKNAYTFASGISSAGHRFSDAMDMMSSKGLTLKNQLGSALISLLTAIAPVINAIIGLITRMADALSQFFAMFTGGTYLKAVNNTQSWGGAAEDAAAATKEWKNQILGFDEINRLEAPGDSGSGGGGIGGIDPSAMFVDTPIDGVFADIRDKFKELLDSLDFGPLEEAWGKLKEAAQGLGDTIKSALGWAWENILVPLAHWTIEQAVPEVINALAAAFDFLNAVLVAIAPFLEETWNDFLKPIAEFAGDAFLEFLRTLTDLLRDLTSLLNGEMSFQEFIDQLTPLESVLLAVGTAFGVVYGAIALFNGVMAICTGVAAVLGPVIAFLTSPIGLVVAAIAVLVAAGIALYKNWDEIKAKAIETWDGIKAKWEEVKTNLSNSWNEFKTNAKQSFEETGENIRTAFQNAIDAVKQVWEDFKSWIEGKWDAFKSWWDNLSLGTFHIPLPHFSIEGEFSLMPPSVPSISIDWYAKGGFPEDGLFMANHGELVGQFSNGRTAVANNEQIIEGIRQGVYEAVTAAMGNDNSGGNHVAVLNVNGREFARAIYSDQKAVAKEHGISLISG